MRFQILGTAAAERFPALWCECVYCAEARKNGGRDIRRTACYLLEDDTLIDFGPDIHWQVTEFGIDLTKIRRVLLTHSHGDHLSPLEFLWRKEWFSKVSKDISVIGSPPSLAAILRFAAEDSSLFSLEKDLHIRPFPIGHGIAMRDGNLEITALDASHAAGKQALNFLLERDGKTIFIGNDSGWPYERTLEILSGRKIDLVIADCTGGLLQPDLKNGHMGANTVLQLKNKLSELGCVTSETRCIATHFSHNGGGSQKEFEAFFSPCGIEPAYDGMVLDL